GAPGGRGRSLVRRRCGGKRAYQVDGAGLVLVASQPQTKASAWLVLKVRTAPSPMPHWTPARVNGVGRPVVLPSITQPLTLYGPLPEAPAANLSKKRMLCELPLVQ